MQNHYSISIVDPKDLLPFRIEKRAGIKKRLKEEIREKKKLDEVISLIKKYNLKVLYLGEDRERGRHIERFLLQDGYMEIIMEYPVSITASFLDKKTAGKYANAFQKIFKEIIPDSDLKELFIDSVLIEKKEPLSRQNWDFMRSIYLQKSAVFAVVVASIIFIFESMSYLIELLIEHFFAQASHGGYATITPVVISAILISFFHEPAKLKIERLMDRVLS